MGLFKAFRNEKMSKIKVLFICHGNICRSVSAEYIMKDLAKKNGVDLYVSSAATSREEIGNDIYSPAITPPTRKKRIIR